MLPASVLRTEQHISAETVHRNILPFIPHSHMQEEDKTRNLPQELFRGLGGLARGYQRDKSLRLGSDWLTIIE